MNCEILSTLYVRANGQIPCHDDAGETIHLGQVRDVGPSTIDSLVTSAPYQRIRDALSNGEVPWPGTCEQCAFLNGAQETEDNLARRRIVTLQVEPSLLCSLNCPGCSRARQVVRRPGPHLMHPSLLDGVLADCAKPGFEIKTIDYCGQGEPLANPRFSEFVRISQRRFPKALLRLVTNGNYDYHSAIGNERIDEVCISCDGVTQSSYEKYRRNGSFGAAKSFMADALSAPSSRRPYVIWKYILFEHNDSPEQLIAAQDLAVDLGVDQLVFIITHSSQRSRRYTARTAATVPIMRSLATVQTTPILARGERPRSQRFCSPMRPLAQIVRTAKPVVMRRRALRRFVSRSCLLKRVGRAAERAY